jgi:hypothetical protein
MDNKTTKQSHATLTIISATLSVDELVQAIGLTPDRTVEKGTQVKGKGGGVHRYSAASFESRPDRQAPPPEHIDDLLIRLSPAKEAILKLADGAHAPGSRGVPVRLSVYIFESAPRMVGLDLSAAQLMAIGEFGAHFGVVVDTDCESDDE